MNVLLRKKVHFLLLLLLSAGRLMASPDCPIVTANFAGLSDGTTVNNSSTGWYLNAANVASTGYFAVKSNRLHAQELGGEGIWYSKVFSVSGYSEFQVAVKITSEGDMNSSEYVKIYYKINGGAETLLEQRTGNFGTIDFISPVLTGSNVQLVVKIYNYNNGGSQTSKYYIEEYRVFKDKGPCGSSIPVSASAGNGGMITCTNSSVTLSASSSASGVTWSWTGPNGFSSTSQNPVVSTPGTYTVTGSSSSGSGSATVTVTQNTTAPVATATGGALACGTSVTLNATSNISGSTYSWTGPNGFSSSQQNPTVSAAGSYTVVVTNPANGCTDTETVSVTSGANTPVSFWTEDFTFSNGTTVDNGATPWSLSNSGSGTFSVQSNELMASFSTANEGTWSSGSINISGKNNISFSVNLRSGTASSSDYLESDDYIRVYYKLDGGAETLIFEDYAGLDGINNATASATVTSPIPTGSTVQIIIKLRNSHSTERYYADNIVLSGITAGTGDSVTTSVSGIATCTANAQIFATASSTASAWSWTGPNGFTSSVQNPVVSAGGQYIVTATLSGGCTASAVATVAENKTLPDVSASGGDLACLSAIVINANSTVAGATYSWTGPNSFSSTSKNPTVSTAGTYTVTVTNPANGCTSSQAVNVTAGYGTPSTQWTENFTFANGTTVDNGATAWSTSVSPSTGVIAVNSNQMRITNIGTTGEAVWTSGSINITGLAGVGISAGVRSSVSGDGVMNTTGEYADYIRFYYRLNGGAEVLFAERIGTINSHSTTLSAVSVGSLSGSALQIVVRARATGNNEFYHFDNVTVTGASASTLTATASAGSIITCNNTSVTLNGSSNAAGATYSWTGPGSFASADQNPVVSTAGIYTLSVTDPSTGCTATDTALVSANVTLPGATATANGQLTCNISSVTISGSSSTAGVTYSWTGPGSFTSTDQNPVVNTAGTYTLTVSNPVNGCTSTDTALVSFSNTTSGTLWLEDFTLANGTTTDNGATSWSTTVSPSTGVIAVNSNQIRITNIGTTGEAVWTSGVIDISGKTNVNISAGVRSSVINNAVMNTTGEYTDYLRFYYKLNGGAEVLFAERLGTINNHSTTPTSISTGSLSGSTLQIVVRARATGNDEFYHFDNMQVSGTGASTVTATAAADGILTCANTSVNLTGSSETSGASYSWTGPGGYSSAEQNPVVSVAGTYILTVSISGCTATDTVVVAENVAAPAAPDITAPATLLTCTTDSIQLSGSSSTGGTELSWSGPGSYTASGDNAWITAPGTYYLTATDTANGCTAVDSVAITQNITAPANVQITTDSTVINCTNNYRVLIANSSTPGVTYQWLKPDGTTPTAVAIPATTAGVYYLTVTNPVNGCTAGDSIVMTENKTFPSLTVSPNSAILTCTNDSIVVTATVSANATYYWLNPNNSDTVFSNVITVTEPGSYRFTAKDTISGCTVSIFSFIAQNSTAPTNVAIAVSSASGSTELTCTNNSVTLSGSATSSSSVAYHWTGPDGFESSAQVINVANPGEYELSAINLGTGCATMVSTTVVQNIAVPANVTIDALPASAQLTCINDTVELTGSSSTPGVNYSWTGPGSFSSGLQNPQINVAGTYQLTVTDTANGCSATASRTVTENRIGPANVNATASEPISCNAPSVFISGNSSTSGVTYSWEGPNGYTSASTFDEISVPGNYVLTVTDPSNGCTTIATAVVLADTAKPAGVGISDNGPISCNTPVVTLTGNTTSTGVDYGWELPGGSIQLGQTLNITTAGTYKLLVVFQGNGCISEATKTITGNTIGPSNVNATASEPISCNSPSVFISGSSSTPGVIYSWEGPEGFTSANTFEEVFVPGNYVLTVTDPTNGCATVATAVVEADTVKPVGLTATNTGPLSCSNTTVTLNGSSTTPNVDYGWQLPDNSIVLGSSITVSTPGTYTLLVVKQSNGCISTATTVVTGSLDGCGASERTTTGPATQTVSMGTVEDDNVKAFQYKAWPNPAANKTFLGFSSPKSAKVTVGIYNSVGICQKVLFNNTVKSNEYYKLELDGYTLPAGSYYYIIQVDNKRYMQKLLLIK